MADKSWDIKMVGRKEGHKMNFWKEWRIWLLILAVIGSLIAISPNPWASGVVVKYVDKDSPFYGEIFPGERISSINERGIQSTTDMLDFENYTGMLRVFHNGKLTLKEVKGNLGLEVKNIGISNLNLGMDLVGGTRVLLRPVYEEEMNESDKNLLIDRVISTLQTRMNVYGLKEIKFQAVKDVAGNRYVQIEMAGASKKEIDDLLEKQGKFEAYIPRMVKFVNGSGVVEIGDKNYTIAKAGENITVMGETIGINDTINLGKIEFKVWNVTNESCILAGKVFTSEDIKYVYFDPQHSYVRRYGKGWEFSFQILVSDEGAERFANITEDIPVEIDSKTGESYLQQRIYLFLDETLMDSLRISAGLAGRAYSTPMITGGGNTEKEVVRNERRLQSILSSGALPVKLEAVRVDTISPSLGSQFMKSVLVAMLGALIAVSVIVSLRYKTWKIVLPIMLTCVSEIIIILGVASIIKWTIDLSAIAGIIATVGTGVDAQIIITDEVSGRRDIVFSMKERVKRAFFIIFGTASTTVAAMIPLGVIGIGLMRGFAVTTIIGVLTGVFITRPSYSKIIELLEIG